MDTVVSDIHVMLRLNKDLHKSLIAKVSTGKGIELGPGLDSITPP